MVLALLVHRDLRLRKPRIGEGADGNCHDVWHGVQQIEDSGAAFRTEVEPRHAALVSDEQIFRAPTFNSHPFGWKPGLGTEHGAGAPLACQAMADRDPDGISLSSNGELPAATGREVIGHGV